MKSLHKYFCWYYYRGKNNFYFALSVALFFWLFLAVTQPFGIHTDSVSSFLYLLLWLFPTAVIWVGSILLSDLLFQVVFKGRQRDQIYLDALGWGFKLLLIIHAIFVFRSYSCDWNCMDLKEYLQLMFACILNFFLVYLPFANYARAVYLKSVFSGEEAVLNKGEIQLGEGKNAIILDPGKIVYLESDGNYLDLFTVREKGVVGKTTIRSTLGSMETLLEKEHPSFKRVHRSYIINMNYYASMGIEEGNTQIQLSVNGETYIIPVSRKYKAALKEFF